MDDFRLGEVHSVTSAGVRIIFDGTDQPTTKSYKRLSSASLSAGDRVAVIKASGTYIVLGKIV